MESTRFLVGCSGGIDEKTALVEMSVSAGNAFGAEADRRIRAGALALCPEQPLFGVAESDWPMAFLLSSQGSNDKDVGRLGCWVVALTVAIQRWGRDPVWRGRVVQAEPHRLRLAIPWQRKDLFTAALELSLELLRRSVEPMPDSQLFAWLAGGSEPEQLRLSQLFGDRWASILADGIEPETLRFVEAGVARGMPFDRLSSFVQLGWGANAERFDMAFTGQTGWMASAIAGDKWKFKKLMASQAIRVPRGYLVGNVEQAEKVVVDDLGWPVVIKPVNQELGLGVVIGIPDADTLRRVFDRVAQHSPGRVIVEKHVDGYDYRLLVVKGRYLAAARRMTGAVTGDGESTVQELVELVNADALRGTSRYSMLKKLVLDDEAFECLCRQGIDARSVPALGRQVELRQTANISSGGTAEDVTESVHPDNRALAERVARIVGLDIVGVDFLTTDISRSWREVDGQICEVNGQPGFRPHWVADPDRDINGEVLDLVFAGRPARIPTAAITGTNGKTTTAQMLFHIWMTAGKFTAVCTTQLVRVGDEIVSTENLSGQPGARIILNDPAVEAAVFEMPRKGLIYFGHPCDHYDVAALLNVQDDHIGVDGITSLEQMAELKAEVLERARQAVVINADDPLCLAMRSRAGTDRHILVTDEPANTVVAEHRRRGGEAVFTTDINGTPCIVLATGDHEEVLMPAHAIPATINGLLRFNRYNAMFASALAWAQGIDTGAIRRALSSFHNSVEQNPGRYNFIDGLPYRVLLDYAHNPEGVREVCSVAAALPVAGRRILCSCGVGNRHAAHFAAVAPSLAETFDEFVLGCPTEWVRESPDYAGPDPVAAMLSAACQLLLDHGVSAEAITSVPVPAEAIHTALKLARSGDLLVVLDECATALPVINEYRRSFL